MNKQFDWIPAIGDWVECDGVVFQVEKRRKVVIGGFLNEILLSNTNGDRFPLSYCNPSAEPEPLTDDELQTCIEMCRDMLDRDLDLGDVMLFRHIAPVDRTQIFAAVDPVIQEEFDSIVKSASRNPVEVPR